MTALNHVVWHSSLRVHACLFSSSKHAFTGFWLCTTTACGSVKVFPSHALPPRKINPLPRIKCRGRALTLRAVCNQHGAAVGTPWSPAWRSITPKGEPVPVWWVKQVTLKLLNLTTETRLFSRFIKNNPHVASSIINFSAFFFFFLQKHFKFNIKKNLCQKQTYEEIFGSFWHKSKKKKKHIPNTFGNLNTLLQ